MDKGFRFAWAESFRFVSLTNTNITVSLFSKYNKRTFISFGRFVYERMIFVRISVYVQCWAYRDVGSLIVFSICKIQTNTVGTCPFNFLYAYNHQQQKQQQKSQ